MKNGMMTFFGLLILISFGQIVYANATAEEAAVKAAQSWLDLVDNTKYEASWQEAASIFKGAVSQESWISTIKGVRGPLGKVVKRTLKSKQYTKTMPGAPDGEYVVIQYETSFENKKTAIETITPTQDKDGKWKVSGYYVR